MSYKNTLDLVYLVGTAGVRLLRPVSLTNHIWPKQRALCRCGYSNFTPVPRVAEVLLIYEQKMLRILLLALLWNGFC